ncbi:NAD(P)H-dependent flavin oxidoreductase [Actinoplanes derwentensis]|uniref:Enoyl-[acyl-carrier protein] reductase II n=1 Tax=Actinoplanes derwentensis TaxID=113562 RepID=A0A1H1S7U8_9ACTN|nr:nitronate monooxygenase [Actinoplanes derwentensis]GID89689.1 2-nitropropane dioxygenase [Actinoplanes derwentensis]SDS43836.1 enoyl-[acyl-carrier protein] reductase II [Actinoplanes derwentensis]
MQIKTRLTDEYGLRTPIVQAGMAFVGMNPELAVAVSNAGAMGSLGVGLMPPPAVAATIGAIRSGTDGPFHVNMLTPFSTDELIDVVCEAGVPAASFHWGHPSRRWIDRLHDAGVRVFEQVGSVPDARRAAGDGIDVIVAQGLEAGGHNFGTLPTFALVPLVVDAVAPALVLASGGIADGRGLAAALMLGADGVWIGTRLVATDESGAHDGYKDRLVKATDTVLTALFGPETPDFNPMRVLRNRVIEEHPNGGGDRPVIGHTVLGGQEIELLRYTNLVPMRDATTGDLEEMPLLAGQGVGLIDAVKAAGTVIADMTAEAEAMLTRCGRW